MTMYRVVVAGGGTGGLSMAAKMVRDLGQNNVALIEPKWEHTYQPLWTLVGGGLRNIDKASKPMKHVLPTGVHWENAQVTQFDPDNNSVLLSTGKKLQYEYLIVALGITPDYDKVPGLMDGLENYENVCSNYDAKYVTKTFAAIQGAKNGTALFTHPDTPIKCPGATQKIAYLAEDYVRKQGNRDKVDFAFATAGAAIFGIPRYAEQLALVAARKDIKVHLKHTLTEVIPKNNTAVFKNLTDPAKPKTVEVPYSMLHVGPPFKAPDVISRNEKLAAPSGYLDINTDTLQHKRYPNVFGIGDNINIDGCKTAAGVAAQCGILKRNLDSVIDGKIPSEGYDGYTSCPLVTGDNKGILAEFDGKGQPFETWPFLNQHKESTIWYILKAHMLPPLYWQLMVRGLWNGPAFFRNLFRFGL